MNTISLIAAVHPPSVPYLLEAYESLAAPELPNGRSDALTSFLKPKSVV